MLVLEHGKPMVFGKDRDKGIRLNGLRPEVVELGKGIDEPQPRAADHVAEPPRGHHRDVVPAPEQLAGLDALVFDIQDIGCRFYTYPATLINCLEAAAKARKKFIVLDRANPIGGNAVEGPLLVGTNSFVAWHKVPLRHGLTLGEVARRVGTLGGRDLFRDDTEECVHTDRIIRAPN